MTDELKQYAVVTNCNRENCEVEHYEEDDGEWVKYEDAQAGIDRLRGERDELVAALDSEKAQRDEAREKAAEREDEHEGDIRRVDEGWDQRCGSLETELIEVTAERDEAKRSEANAIKRMDEVCAEHAELKQMYGTACKRLQELGEETVPLQDSDYDPKGWATADALRLNQSGPGIAIHGCKHESTCKVLEEERERLKSIPLKECGALGIPGTPWSCPILDDDATEPEESYYTNNDPDDPEDHAGGIDPFDPKRRLRDQEFRTQTKVLEDTRKALKLVKTERDKALKALDVQRTVTAGTIAALSPAEENESATPQRDPKVYATTDGQPPDPGSEHEGAPQPINPATGQHDSYWILSEEERAKGFVRPVRLSYKHLTCGKITTMSQGIAETYARLPSFYGATFCCGCKIHFLVGEDGEFVWLDEHGKETAEKVGT